MSPEERIPASRFGAFARSERLLWSARYPEDVAPITGEFEWIALGLADLA